MANSVDPDQFWVHAVCFYTKFVSNVRQLFAVDDIFRCIFLLGALRVKTLHAGKRYLIFDVYFY